MGSTFEELLVRHSSPTLKGIKSGSLFTYRPASESNFTKSLSSYDRHLAKKGVRVRSISGHGSAKRILVYRPKMIEKLLSQVEPRCILCSLGYPVDQGHENNVAFLMDRFKDGDGFPHEIGLFLGYPLDDVKGFIKNKGRNYTLCGLWKVYGDLGDAKEKFEEYKQCREHCLECLRQGQSVLQLILAD